jgi:hypothetical protein
MTDIPNFEDALKSFCEFLAKQGHPTNVFWVFRDDIWKRSPTSVVLRSPAHEQNLALAQKVFEEGRARGLVDVHAIATIGDKVAATVWFPKLADEESEGWDGMKLSIAQPLPRAELVRRLRWLLFHLKPQFRHYQRFDIWVGTKAWAASQHALGAD